MIVPDSFTLYKKPQDRMFSIGLSYYEIMNLSEDQLTRFLVHISRDEAIDWLQWNDPNGIYSDNDSIQEFDNIISKSEAMNIIKKQIFS